MIRGVSKDAGTLLQSVSPILDRRLRPASAAPLAVALSGGGDSLALLLLVKAWADARGRRVIALTVDHGLNPASTGWTDRCRKTAARLGVDFRALHWTGDKPATGLPAAARQARHARLAEAAREAGASVLLMGHTADDLSESAAMRVEGSTVPDAREWAPSPAWPEGRGVFLLRPLLGVSRAALRAFLREAGEDWIDDPANEDLRFARARARALQSSPRSGEGDPAEQRGGESAHRLPSTALPAVPLPSPAAWGGLILPLTTPPSTLAAAALCAAGTARPPRGASLARIIAGLRRGDPFTVTLAGARIEVGWTDIIVMRDAGEITRGGLAPLDLPAGRTLVWDGRFEVTAAAPGLRLVPLAGLAAKLPESERKRLSVIPSAARPTLPVIFDGDGAVSCPILAERSPVRVRALALARFEAATGGVDSEPAP